MNVKKLSARSLVFKLFIIFTLFTFLSACDDDSMNTSEETMSGQTCANLECEAQNKLMVEQIYSEVINASLFSMLPDIFADDVTSNTSSDNGLENTELFYQTLVSENPSKVATVKHIVGDGEYVAVHWHYSTSPEDEKSGEARIDLFRIEDSLVVEYWSNSMIANSETESGNSLFSDLYDYGEFEANTDPEIEEQNKVVVSNFYSEIFNNHNLEIFDLLVYPDYIQHNQRFDTGSAVLRLAVENMRVGPISIFLSLAENDLVWTFTLSDANQLDVVDLWRFDNNIDKIVEHWDVFVEN